MRNFNKLLIAVAALLVFTFNAAGQSTTSPDTVCATANKVYDVNPNPGATYTWGLKSSLGSIVTTSNSDSIRVNWGTTPGVDTLWVVEAGPIGCPGDTMKLAVVIIAVPTATIAGLDSLCINNSWAGNQVSVALTSVGPWTFTYSYDLDGAGAGAATSTNITTSSSTYNVSSPTFTSAGVVDFTLVSVSNKFCSGTTSGTGSVTVFPKPTTPSIQHY